MAAALERAGEEGAQDGQRHLLADQPAAEGEHVGVVMGARQAWR